MMIEVPKGFKNPVTGRPISKINGHPNDYSTRNRRRLARRWISKMNQLFAKKGKKIRTPQLRLGRLVTKFGPSGPGAKARERMRRRIQGEDYGTFEA